METRSNQTGQDDVYTNIEADHFPGARARSKPGTGPNETFDKVLDPSGSGRYVSAKPANKAFLKAKAKREAHAQKVRDRQNAPSSGPSWTSILILLAFLPLLSSFLTNTYTFTLGPKYIPGIRKWVETTSFNPYRTQLKVFTPEQLAKFDGRDKWLPVYVGIKGEVYDVSKNKRIYGKGGSYNMMAGRDASRSFVTGCFETHLTHDLRGFSNEQLDIVEGWRKFFANHKDYRLIGHVNNPPIDPSTPIPRDCNEEGAEEEEEPAAHAHGPMPNPAATRRHEEL